MEIDVVQTAQKEQREAKMVLVMNLFAPNLV